MLVTRSSASRSQQTRPALQDTQPQLKPTGSVQQTRPGPEVIVLSSDSDEAPDSSLKATKRRRKRPREKLKSPTPEGENRAASGVTTSSASLPSAEHSTVAALQAKINLLDNENRCLRQESLKTTNQLKHEISALTLEASQLRAALQKAQRTNNSLDLSALEENVTCPVCDMKMWSPYVLAECGHTFCESCLQDWFSTILAQHMQNNPHFNVNQPLPRALRQTLENPNIPFQLQAHLVQQITTMQPPRPQYTCPTCRKTVKTKPVEDFTVKAIVRTIAQASREFSPQKAIDASRPRQNPWEAYFPEIFA